MRAREKKHESGLVVVTEERDNSDVGKDILKHIRKKNHLATIQELAEAANCSVEQATMVIDSYKPGDDGKSVVQMGVGRGGGWLTEEQMLDAHPEMAAGQEES